MRGTYEFTFDQKNSLQYALEAFVQARDFDPTTVDDVSLARNFYRFAIVAREKDEPFTNVNLNIRDVEYFGRGFSGGKLLADLSKVDVGDLLNEIANAYVPISAPIYVAKKEIFGRDSVVSEGAGPASQAGGSEEAISGWVRAINEEELEAAIRAEFLDFPVARPQSPSSGPVLHSPLRLAPQSLQATSARISALSAPSPAVPFKLILDVTGPSADFVDQRETDYRLYVSSEGVTPGAFYAFDFDVKPFVALGTFGSLIDQFWIESDANNAWDLLFGGAPSRLTSGEIFTIDPLADVDALLLGLADGGKLGGMDRLHVSFRDQVELAVLGFTSFAGDTRSGPIEPAPIPLPASGLLLPLGLGLLAARKRFGRN